MEDDLDNHKELQRIGLYVLSGRASPPLRRRFSDDSPMLESGHELRELSCDAVRQTGKARLAAWEEAQRSSCAQKIICGFCREVFWSVRAHEEHVGAAHSHICVKCGSGFHAERWLTQHVQEAHDAYFAALVRRGTTPMFACVAFGCTAAKFKSSQERDDHLSSMHGYPPGGLRKLRRRKFYNETLQGATQPCVQPLQQTPSSGNSASVSVQRKKAGQHHLEKRVCKHFTTAKGCRYGAECIFQHSVAQSSPAVIASAAMSEDAGVDQITEALEALTTQVPAQVFFGRRGRGSARLRGGGR